MAQIQKAKEAGDLFEKAISLGNEKAFAKAIEVYSEVLKLLPNDNDTFLYRNWEKAKDEIYGRRGGCYEDSEQFEKALDDYNKAISLNQKNASNYIGRARVYVALGEIEKANADTEKAVELDRENACDYYFYHGQAIFKYSGNKKEAAVFYKKAAGLSGFFADEAKAQLADWKM